MQKILILSDTHGSDFSNILQHESVDFVLHAGDSQLLKDDELINQVDYVVSGNCDFVNFPNSICESLGEGIKFLLVHGHNENVKINMSSLVYTALEQNATICIYGHTHVPHVEYLSNKNLLILNPGSTILGRSKYRNTYLILEIDNINKKYKVSLKNSKDFSTIEQIDFINEKL